MSENKLKVGSFCRIGFTFFKANDASDFDSKVAGWKPGALSMDDYND